MYNISKEARFWWRLLRKGQNVTIIYYYNIFNAVSLYQYLYGTYIRRSYANWVIIIIFLWIGDYIASVAFLNIHKICKYIDYGIVNQWDFLTRGTLVSNRRRPGSKNCHKSAYLVGRNLNRFFICPGDPEYLPLFVPSLYPYFKIPSAYFPCYFYLQLYNYSDCKNSQSRWWYYIQKLVDKY